RATLLAPFLLQLPWQFPLHRLRRASCCPRHCEIPFRSPWERHSPATLHAPLLHCEGLSFSSPSLISLTASLSCDWPSSCIALASFLRLSATALRSLRVSSFPSNSSSDSAALLYSP